MIDCYVLSPVRSAHLATRFLDSFLPDREPSFDADDPSEVLGLPSGASLDVCCTFLVDNPTTEYTLYWRSSATDDPRHAIVAFNSDGSLVLGLSVGDPEPTTDGSMQSLAQAWCNRLAEFAATAESPAPLTHCGGELAPPCRLDFATR